MSAPLIEFRDVAKRFGSRVAVDGVSFGLSAGATLGIVGESGSGKSTCIRMAIGLDRPTAGEIRFRGKPYPRSQRGLREIRRRLGLVMQDPYDSLDPRMRIGDIVAEPLRIDGVRAAEARDRAATALAPVGLPDAPLDAYPARYSGGGRQRIAIARALIRGPEVLLCDEPTASLDVSVQSQIINLLLDLRDRQGLSMIFVSHDIDLVRTVSTHIVVMRAGRVVETGAADEVVRHPVAAYTRELLAAVPAAHPAERKILPRPAA